MRVLLADQHSNVRWALRTAIREEPEMVELIYRAMDEEDMDISTLPQKELEYAKTAQVLMGKSLYSHSWLEV